MKNQKFSLENFTSKALLRNQISTILGKGGATTLPEIDEDGNIVNSGSGSGPGPGATGPGAATNSGNGDAKP